MGITQRPRVVSGVGGFMAGGRCRKWVNDTGGKVTSTSCLHFAALSILTVSHGHFRPDSVGLLG